MPTNNNLFGDRVLKHYGIKGMHWGVRRYQNPDGSLTPAGKERKNAKTLDTKKVLTGLAIAGTVAGGVYLTKNISDRKLVAETNDAIKEAVSLGEKNLDVSKKESERISKPDITEDEIRDSYNKVIEATEKSIKAEKHANDLINKAEKRNLISNDVASFRYRTTDEYIPHWAPLTWFESLKDNHSDIYRNQYSSAEYEWWKRHMDRDDELM